MSPVRPRAARPSRLLLALESRSVGEFGSFFALAPVLLPLLPRGEGQPVLVLPGFFSTDASTAPLRWLLGHLGYPTYGWDMGRNLGPTDQVLDGLVDRVDELVQTHGEPLSIVGWSLGGIYARDMARLAPDHVRDVVTLGSPIQMEEPDETSTLSPLHELLRESYSDKVVLPRIPDRVREPLPVPSTAVYSRTDGIVAWADCLDIVDEHHDNVEIYGSHCGLGYNPAAMVVIADRLAQSPGFWEPFEAPAPLAHLYPTVPQLSGV